MTRFYFKLLVQLPPGSPEPMSYLDALYEAGCDDTTIGIGDTSLQIHFIRHGADLYAVIAEAEAAVRHTIPEARIEWRWDHEMEECDREYAEADEHKHSLRRDRQRYAVGAWALSLLRLGAKRAWAVVNYIDECLGYTKEEKEAFGNSPAGKFHRALFILLVALVLWLAMVLLGNYLGLGL
ncbi:hypothetical protein [Ferrovibrio xuzhouensis]|uniref:Uncharacterized protein n=1 Tax=Ferrovibrio xuzhouensis TaxID=1576914 RepID=A0ABV7VJU0_9PROT